MENFSLVDYIESLRQGWAQLDLDAVKRAALRLDQARRERHTIFIIGNGGSAATASHFTNDLNKLASRNKDPMFRAMCLTDNVPLLTALANDYGYDKSLMHFNNFALPDDVLIVISTSGQSQNLMMVADEARARGIYIIAIVGNALSTLAQLANLTIVSSAPRQTQQEDLALAVCHMLAEALQ